MGCRVGTSFLSSGDLCLETGARLARRAATWKPGKGRKFPSHTSRKEEKGTVSPQSFPGPSILEFHRDLGLSGTKRQSFSSPYPFSLLLTDGAPAGETKFLMPRLRRLREAKGTMGTRMNVSRLM